MAGMSRASPSDTLLLMDGATGKGQGNSRFPALVMRWVTAPIIQVGETWGGQGDLGGLLSGPDSLEQSLKF